MGFVEYNAFFHYKKHQARALLCERVLWLAVALYGIFFYMMIKNDSCINVNKGSGDCVSSIVWPGRCPRVSQPGLGRNPTSAKRRIKKHIDWLLECLYSFGFANIE